MPIATLTAVLMMFVSPMVGVNIMSNSTAAVSTEHSATSQDAVFSASQDSVLVTPQRVVEQQVRGYYKEEPILAEIAFCESSFRQLDATGNVVRGKVDSADVGVMQINERYHAVDAKKLGYDIYTIEGNMAYAKYLYDKQGTVPWKSSQPCWGKSVK